MRSIYENITETNQRLPDGHRLYNATCHNCGHQTTGRQLSLKRVKTCTHVYRNTNIKLLRIPDRRIGHIFSGMVRRCYNKSSKDYQWYGQTGVKICDEWLYEDMAFYNWFIAQPGHDKRLEIDRINPYGDYCPENCRLVLPAENSRWKRSTNEITVNGITKSGRQWSEFLGKGINHINRYCRKHGKEKAIDYIAELLQNH